MLTNKQTVKRLPRRPELDSTRSLALFSKLVPRKEKQEAGSHC